LHSKLDSGHLAHAGQGGHLGSLLGLFHELELDPEFEVELFEVELFEVELFEVEPEEPVMQTGHTGGTICDFKIYKSS
jgi:hypothetical protein